MKIFRHSLTVSILFALIVSITIVSNYNLSFAKPDYIPHATAIPQATVFMTPPKVAGLANQNVTVKANVTQITRLFAFQMGLRFDPEAVECLGVEEGGFLSKNGVDSVLSFSGQIDNTTGTISAFSWTLTDTAKAKNGSGTLVEFKFQMKTTGYSNIHIMDFEAVDATVTTIPVKTLDSYTPLRDQSENSVTITGNAQYAGFIGPEAGYSNHNLSRLFFGPQYYNVNFNVTGYPVNGDSFAFCNVSIPKSFMYAHDFYAIWMLFLNDEIRTVQSVEENATHTSLYFEFAYNASKPTTKVNLGLGISLENPYPKASLSVWTSNWWYSRGDSVAVRAGFTIDDAAVTNGTVVMRVVYPNMSVYVGYFNITEPDGNATFTFRLDEHVPFGNYSIQLLAGKLGVPGAYAVKYFWVWNTPLIQPYPHQYVNYHFGQYDQNNNLVGKGWFNMTYIGYLEPNLINCSVASFFVSSSLGNQTGNGWAGVNTTTRWIPAGTVQVGNFFDFWIQTNVTLGSEIRILNTTGIVTGSQVLMFRLDDGTVGFIDAWQVDYIENSVGYTSYFDKRTGLNVYENAAFIHGRPFLRLWLGDTNIPIAYNWGDINYDGAVNGTDAQLVRTAWQTQLGNVNFNHDADFNLDGIVNISDVAVIGYNWQHKRMVLP